ncbi:S8 family serine peptidase [uncultured Phycicoccus sp.]|uniref:S8 family serine peptidase n=1 Tax=uncultured Phycicoccus sp. TaxID=661422 RepID=UPI00260CB2A7|nr:S8 family serine peptidase [uncultured Phycicoccus sp.]
MTTADPFKDLAADEDEFDVVHEAVLTDGELARYGATRLPDDVRHREKDREDKCADEPAVEPVDHKDPASKIHPLLRERKGKRASDAIETVVVTFRDELAMPRFPEPDVDQPRDCCDNARELERADALADTVRRRRADDYQQLTERLGRVDAKVTDTFWLIRGVQARMPLAGIEELAEDEEVLYIEPDDTEDAPPQNDVVDGRRDIVSDPYFGLGLTSGWIGLLDTGVRRTHVVFNSPSHIDFMRDCVNGGADCNTGTALNPADDCWDHGTASAAIITANNRQGNAFRGVTGITLDSWKVYPSSVDASGNCNGFLNVTAAVRGFENAVRVLDRVIVAEMQGSGDDRSAIAVAADNAFDAGAVVIAANGNNGPGASTVNVPANAHKALGVGNFDVQSGTQVASQSRGPAPDGRFKPDIQAPTNTETASNASDTARRVFGGTSGATPYAAGAAALLRNWLRRPTGSIDPGQVYAQMILSGQNPYPFTNTEGAGPIELPTNGVAWWGKVTVRDGENVDIPLPVNAERANTLDAALWWPEGGVRIFGFQLDWHSDIDLHLIDPSGATRASSISIPSVFERARVGGRIATGTWRLRIRGYRVPSVVPTVYWAAHVRTR